jgi:SAM-dependent methyltransferase
MKDSATQEEVKDTWEQYWEHTHFPDFELPPFNSYHIPVFHLITDLIKKEGFKKIMGAGCGQDYVAAYLQKEFSNSLDFTLLDISPKVLAFDAELFKRNNLSVATVESSIFTMPFPDNSFDLIFNTGLMEHFTPEDQTLMVREVMRVLRPGGYYVSANPSDKGIIYKYGMRRAKEKGIWPFGVETPIRSLRFTLDGVPEVGSLIELERDFAGQLNFFSYVNKFLQYASKPLRMLARVPFIHGLFDMTLGKVFGTYLLISVFRKRA